MKSQTYHFTLHHLLGTAGAFALAFCATTSLQAQLAVVPGTQVGSSYLFLNAASLHPAAPRVATTLRESAAPDPPQNNAAMKDDLFAGTEKFAKGASEATEVNMDPDSLNLVGGSQSAHARNMLLNVVHTYSYDKPGMYNMADVDEFRHKLDGPDWHCSVHSRDLKSGESTDICSRRRAPDLIEQAIITVEPRELTFIHQIRKANGQGGNLDLGGLPGLSMLPGILSGNSSALRAAIKADLLASTAGLRAELPLLQQQEQHLHLPGPALQKLLDDRSLALPSEAQEQIEQLTQKLRFNMSREQQRQIEELRKQLKNLQP